MSGEGGTTLSESAAVAAVLSALALADHPGDTASAYHVATSPLGPLVDLPCGARPAAVAAASYRIRRDLVEQGYTALIGRWTRQLAPACDDTDLLRLQQLAELAQEYEPTPRPGDFVEAIAVAQAGSAPIRVMTIHAAKGLEFDTVVLPELDKQARDTEVALVQRQAPSGPPSAVLPFADKATRALSPQLQTAYAEARRRRRYEDLCLLYVALTRARRAVHMVIRPRPPRRARRLLAHILHQALAPEIELTEAGDQLLHEAGTPRWFDGLVFHDWFQQVGFADEAGGVPDADRLRALARRMVPALPDQELAAWLDAFHAALEAPGIRSVLARRGARDLWRERAFALRHEGRLLQGRFDRGVLVRSSAGGYLRQHAEPRRHRPAQPAAGRRRRRAHRPRSLQARLGAGASGVWSLAGSSG